MDLRKLNILMVAVLVILLGAIGYVLVQNKFQVASERQQTDSEESVNSNSGRQEVQPRAVYFGKGFEGKYIGVDVESGQTKTFIPEGYHVVSGHEYEPFTPYLILRKQDDVLSYNLATQKMASIFSSNQALKLKKDEEAYVNQSITEPNLFFVQIHLYDPNEEPGMGLPRPISTRSYIYDAGSAKLTNAANFKFNGCQEFDSKNKRFFAWPCGEGIGYSIPLSILDLAGNKQREVVTLAEFGLSNDEIGPVAVHYNDGTFFAAAKGEITKIVTVDPAAANPVKTIYTVPENQQAKVKDAYPYSLALAPEQNTLILGGGSYILLMRFNSAKQITQSSFIQEGEIYANFIFPANGKLYYQAKDHIKTINLDNWKTEKTIASRRDEEITLLSLPQ